MSGLSAEGLAELFDGVAGMVERVDLEPFRTDVVDNAADRMVRAVAAKRAAAKASSGDGEAAEE